MQTEDRVLGMARALGRAIQADDRYIQLVQSKTASDNDKALQDAIGQFNISRMNLNAEISREERDEDKISNLNQEVQRSYEEIMSSGRMSRYQKAKDELNMLVQMVTAIVAGSANGDNPDDIDAASCTGNCNGCAGCN